MRYELVDRRTSEEDRARFEEIKGYVAIELGRVGKRMPRPWFEELVDSLARLRMRWQRPT
jgi:hypothetical protein